MKFSLFFEWETRKYPTQEEDKEDSYEKLHPQPIYSLHKHDKSIPLREYWGTA